MIDSDFGLRSLPYFLSDLGRFFVPNYTPTEQDILRCRVCTTGIAECVLPLAINSYAGRSLAYGDKSTKGEDTDEALFVDVGGRTSERKKWERLFGCQDITAVVFMVNLAGYDQWLVEDRQKVCFYDA